MNACRHGTATEHCRAGMPPRRIGGIQPPSCTRSLTLVIITVGSLFSTGCATRKVTDWGRHLEVLKSCDRAYQHDDNVLLEYTVTWTNAHRTAKRWASVQLDPHFDPSRPTIDLYPRTMTERHDGLLPATLANDAIPIPIIEMDHRPHRNENPNPHITPLEGHYADIVVFDYGQIADSATFNSPYQRARGVSQVFVNGIPVVRDGECTGDLPGRILR